MSATTIEKTIFIKGSPKQVWAFLTDKDKLGAWYHAAESNLVDGADYALISDDGKGKIVWGRVVSMQPHSLLKTTFCISPFGDKESTVTWTLEEAAGGTKLSLTHEGVAEIMGDGTLHMLGSLDVGWDSHLGKLRAELA